MPVHLELEYFPPRKSRRKVRSRSVLGSNASVAMCRGDSAEGTAPRPLRLSTDSKQPLPALSAHRPMAPSPRPRGGSALGIGAYYAHRHAGLHGQETLSTAITHTRPGSVCAPKENKAERAPRNPRLRGRAHGSR